MGDTAKQFSLQNFRPEGFEYPTGLNSTSSANTVVDYLVVAGGGGGGSSYGGGGGAGGFLTASGIPVALSTSYTVTVGAGQPGGVNPSNGSNGSYSLITNSPANTIYAYAVGGGGGAGNAGDRSGRSGGSGGGGRTNGDNPDNGGAGTSPQGNKGGSSFGPRAAGGGGGAGSVGEDGQPGAPGGRGGNGGVGSNSSISGTSTQYSSGGGGGQFVTGPAGLAGSFPSGAFAPGGAGPSNFPAAAANALDNRGGGGGGSSAIDTGGNGGKGIVIIRYTDAFGNTATGGTITTSPSYVIHTFTGDGTFATNADFGGAAQFSIN